MLDWWNRNKKTIITVAVPLAGAALTGGLGWTEAGQAFLKAILPMIGQ